MKVTILGAGAVGAYYGGLLARAGREVTCFARGANLAAIQARGLEVRTPEGGFTVPMAATDRSEDLPPADFAILAVKSYALPDMGPVLRQVAEQGATILPLLNGVETAELLIRAGVPEAAILGGLTKISAVRVAPGVVERKTPFQLVVAGEFDGRRSERVERIVAAFREAGVDARATERIREELWEKWIFIVTLAAACGLARTSIGPLRADPLGRRLLERARDEAVAVTRARGIPFSDDQVASLQALVDNVGPATRPSFLTDLEAGGPTELDVLSGAVSRFAAELGIPVPVHDTAAVALAGRDILSRS